MSKRYVLGVDLGTTAFKTAVFDEAGRCAASAAVEHFPRTPGPGAVVQGAGAYWDAFRESVRAAVDEAGAAPGEVTALSVSAQGETMVFLDEHMEPLCDFLVWMDTRPQAQAEAINRWFTPEEILEVTGQGPITALYPACKILWMKENHPEIFERTYKILLLEDYLFYRLTGATCGEGSLWCTSYLWDIRKRAWWGAMLEKLGISQEQLPLTVETGTPVGRLRPELAAELGLSPDLLLIMGALDQACGAIGVGNVRPGLFSECTGGALVMCTLTDHVALDPRGELPCFYGALPGLYMLHAGGKGGIAYRWLRDALCGEERLAEAEGRGNAYDLMDAQAAKIPPGSDGLTVLPFFGGAGAPDTDQYAKGMIYGLGLEHTKAHLMRAFMEAVAVSLRRMVDDSERVTGLPVTEIRSLGGGAKSPFWCQLKADLLGRRVVTMRDTENAACLGAALIAGPAVGFWPSAAEAAAALAKVERVYEPDPGKRAAYDALLERYGILLGCIRGKTQSL